MNAILQDVSSISPAVFSLVIQTCNPQTIRMPKSTGNASNSRLDLMRIELDAIGHAISDKQLAVPIYQRSYAWEETHVRDLLNDLSDAIEDEDSEYFLGSIVATTGKDGREEIVDGQQRLATTSILIAGIRDFFYTHNDKNRADDIELRYLVVRDLRSQQRTPKLKLNDSDNHFFEKRVLSRPDSTDRQVAPVKDSHRRIINAIEMVRIFLQKIIDRGQPIESLLDVLDFIGVRAKVIWVRVPDDANAFTIFETLNDRGLELAISDLLKNFLFLASEKRLTEVRTNWIAMVATLETVDDESVIVEFIRHFWSSNNGATREKKLYAAIKESIASKQAAVDFSNKLAAGAKLYAAMLNTDHEIWKRFGPTARGHMGTINMLQMVQVRPLLLAILETFAPKETRKALKLIVSWGTRFLIVGGHGAGSLEKQYADRAMEVRSGKITTAKQLASAMIAVVPTDSQFEAAFAVATVSKPALARYYLNVLERQSLRRKDPELVPNTNQEEVNLEHILPQNPSVGWSHVSEEDAKTYYNRLGNHTLMQVTANTSAGNNSFSKKSAVYASSSFKLTSNLAKETNWDIQEIESRQSKLAGLAVKAWPITVS